MTTLKRSVADRGKLWVMDTFGDEQSPKERKGRDWTGTIIGALVSPVLFLFAYFGKLEMGFTVSIVLLVAIIAIKLRWNLRRHAWFWGTIALILALHIPFLSLVQWPQTNVPTLVFAIPLGIIDFFLISGAISLAEKLFSKGDSSDGEDE
jgi:hypothetical protein